MTSELKVETLSKGHSDELLKKVKHILDNQINGETESTLRNFTTLPQSKAKAWLNGEILLPKANAAKISEYAGVHLPDGLPE